MATMSFIEMSMLSWHKLMFLLDLLGADYMVEQQQSCFHICSVVIKLIPLVAPLEVVVCHNHVR